MKVDGYTVKVFYHRSGELAHSNNRWYYCDEVVMPELETLGVRHTLRWRDGHAPFSDSLRGLNAMVRREVESHIEFLKAQGELN